MDKAPPAVVRVLPDPSQPGRFRWHLFDARDMPLDPVIMSEGTFSDEEAARTDGEAALKRHAGAP